MARLVSINVGRPREVEWEGRTIRTSIFKNPVAGPVRVRTLNVDGDEQSDLSVHGGVHKAVYAYPSEHYEWWRGELPGTRLSWGAFGENLTTEGLTERGVCISDRLRIGSAEFVVTQPRSPCFKLGVRFGRPDMVRRFLDAGRSGFYLAVTVEGSIETGDRIKIVAADRPGISVADIVQLLYGDDPDRRRLQQAIDLEGLPERMRDSLRKRLG
jgi:MOSC domain-containing protein YiiM